MVLGQSVILRAPALSGSQNGLSLLVSRNPCRKRWTESPTRAWAEVRRVDKQGWHVDRHRVGRLLLGQVHVPHVDVCVSVGQGPLGSLFTRNGGRGRDGWDWGRDPRGASPGGRAAWRRPCGPMSLRRSTDSPQNPHRDPWAGRRRPPRAET